MSDDKWLWDRPKNWHEIGQALSDIEVLLGYLGTQPDGRLLSYFEETQNRIVDGAAKRTVPPCASYAEFLTLFMQISAAFETGRADLLPTLPPAPGGQAVLTPESFVLWSRDFLSTAAAPATADSIRLTQDYVRLRSARRRWFSAWRRTVGANASAPVPPADAVDIGRSATARRLAGWVRRSETFTLIALFLTVGISIYALSGRLILDNANQADVAWGRIDAQLEAQEDRLLAMPASGPAADFLLLTKGLCGYEEDLSSSGPRPEEASAGSRFAVAMNTPDRATDAVPPVADAAAKPAPAANILTAHQTHLCHESRKALLDLFTVTLHLQSWNSVVTRRIGHMLDIKVLGETIPLGIPLAVLFGVSSTSIDEYVQMSKQGTICDDAAKEVYDPSSGRDGCRKVLLTRIEGTHKIAESILGSITLYILPVCYAFLGAMAATLRLLRRKVDACLLAYTDRARLQQNAILGVLCGGVIGLFAAYLGNASAAGGLGLSALALLAGYNVDGVFRFLDDLSDRIFRGGDTPKPA